MKLVEPGYAPTTRFAHNTGIRIADLIPEAHTEFAGPISVSPRGPMTWRWGAPPDQRPRRPSWPGGRVASPYCRPRAMPRNRPMTFRTLDNSWIGAFET